MLLNNQIPGLPEWPPIRFDKNKNECVVGGTHLSLERYRLARFVFLTIAPTTLGERFFPTRTFVRFTPQQIFINDKKYENSPQVPVQFRANRMALKDDRYYKGIIDKQQKGQLVEGLAFELKFRRVEMVYGSRLIEITSIADEDRAAQFALALQAGYEMAGRLKASVERNAVAKPPSLGDHLPE